MIFIINLKNKYFELIRLNEKKLTTLNANMSEVNTMVKRRLDKPEEKIPGTKENKEEHREPKKNEKKDPPTNRESEVHT